MAVDGTYQTKNYEAEGGAAWVVGGTLEIGPTGSLVMDAGATMGFGPNAVPTSGATVAGQHTVTAGEVTATHTSIATGITTLSALSIMILRAGKIATSDAAPALVGSSLQVSSGSTYTLTAGDIVHFIAVGV